MLFTDITVIRADGTVLEHQYVGIKDRHIDFLGDTRPDGDWGETFDGNNRILMPGFVNAHTHVAMTLMRGYGDDMPLDRWLFDRIFPFEDKLDAEDVYWGSLLGIAEMLSTGTTSFSDMYYFCHRTADAVLQSGIKANIGRGISVFDPQKTFRDLPAYHELKDLFERYHQTENGRVLIDVAPHAEYTNRPDVLADAAEFAAQRGARIQIHVSETQKEHLECVARHGKTPVSVIEESGLFALPSTAAHCVWVSDLDMDVLAVRKVTVAHNPQSNLKLASGIARVQDMQRKGIAVAIGTDSAASNNNLFMLEEARLAALLAKGVSGDPCAMPAGDALYMATRAGALSQGREDCGDIAPGFCADLVVLNTRGAAMQPIHNPLSNVLYAAGSRDVEMTIVDGRMIYCQGDFLTLDIEQIRFEVQRRVKALLKA